MDKFDLTAQRRELKGKLNKKIRKENKIPAIVYGGDISPQMLELDAKEFRKLYQQAGESSLVDLKIDGQEALKVLIQDVQLHPVTDEILHIDFQKVDMAKTISAEIHLKFEGQSPVVAEQGGILVTSLESVQVECLPTDLVHDVPVDLSVLKTFDDKIRIQDIIVPKGITILDKPEIMVATVTPPRTEEELKALDTDVVEDVGKVESIKQKEEAETEEGGKTEEAPVEKKAEDKKDSDK
ncbi:MAG: 50S ribosomal protein L25 [bacterium]